MKLEDIGFYTLSDNRAKTASATSRMRRGEIVLLDSCNFKCSYCRGIQKEYCGSMSFEKAKQIIDQWCMPEPIESIRFSGGEPTLHRDIIRIVEYAKSKGIVNIALSTNGSVKTKFYDDLISFGVNDFSISLDACCSSDGDKMAGGVRGSWDIVTENITHLSKKIYVTVGIVLNEQNVMKSKDIVLFADSLGVADIRIITSAQFNKNDILDCNIPDAVLDRHPILKFRINNIRNGRTMRGIKQEDCRRCPLVLDDSAIVGDSHFPCIIYMRERGNPIGKISENMRSERLEWFKSTDVFNNKICRNNCIDVCVDYNNTWMKYHFFIGNQAVLL